METVKQKAYSTKARRDDGYLDTYDIHGIGVCAYWMQLLLDLLNCNIQVLDSDGEMITSLDLKNMDFGDVSVLDGDLVVGTTMNSADILYLYAAAGFVALFRTE